MTTLLVIVGVVVAVLVVWSFAVASARRQRVIALQAKAMAMAKDFEQRLIDTGTPPAEARKLALDTEEKLLRLVEAGQEI